LLKDIGDFLRKHNNILNVIKANRV